MDSGEFPVQDAGGLQEELYHGLKGESLNFWE